MKIINTQYMIGEEFPIVCTREEWDRYTPYERDQFIAWKECRARNIEIRQQCNVVRTENKFKVVNIDYKI